MGIYLKGVFSEFRRIKWIKGKNMVKTLGIVLAVSAVTSVIVLGLDALFSLW